MDVAAPQGQITATYGARDRERGIDGTFRRLVEEMGEVAKALRERDQAALGLELADVIAWTMSVAALCRVDLNRARSRYAEGCPRCNATPCQCPRDGAGP